VKYICVQGKSGRSSNICISKCAADHTTFTSLQNTPLHKYKLLIVVVFLSFLLSQ